MASRQEEIRRRQVTDLLSFLTSAGRQVEIIRATMGELGREGFGGGPLYGLAVECTNDLDRTLQRLRKLVDEVNYT